MITRLIRFGESLTNSVHVTCVISSAFVLCRREKIFSGSSRPLPPEVIVVAQKLSVQPLDGLKLHLDPLKKSIDSVSSSVIKFAFTWLCRNKTS